MIALIYIGVICYFLIGLSIGKYIIEGGYKFYVALLWFFGWGFYVILALLIMLTLPFFELYNYLARKCKQ